MSIDERRGTKKIRKPGGTPPTKRRSSDGGLLFNLLNPLLKPLKKMASTSDLKKSQTAQKNHPPPPNKTVNMTVKKSSPIPIGNSKKISSFKLDLNQKHGRINEKNPFNANIKSKKRVILTKPSTQSKRNPNDNIENNLIVAKGDIINNRYIVLSMLGKGVYGIVVKCVDLKRRKKESKEEEGGLSLLLSGDKNNVKKENGRIMSNTNINYDDYNEVAIKIIKNHPDFHRQSRIEIELLKKINEKFDHNEMNFVQFLEVFTYLNHQCLVFEMLGDNLFEVISKKNYEGIDIDRVAVITKDILKCLIGLRELNIIHCDLKPENVLVTSIDDEGPKNKKKCPTVKVIDFGSATYEHLTTAWYIQSRFYRSPEVLLGDDYSTKIDMWSLGCICGELFMGLPLFPGCCSYDQIFRIVKYLGVAPHDMIESGKYSMKYFDLVIDSTNERMKYELKSEDKYCLETGEKKRGTRNYFKKPSSTIPEMILTKSYKSGITRTQKSIEHSKRLALIDFLRGVLQWSPQKRWTATQALKHPFITGEEFSFKGGKKWRPSLFTQKKNTRPINMVRGGSDGKNVQKSYKKSYNYNVKNKGVRVVNNQNNHIRRYRYNTGVNMGYDNNSYYDKPHLGQSPNFYNIQLGSSISGSNNMNNGNIFSFSPLGGNNMTMGSLFGSYGSPNSNNGPNNGGSINRNISFSAYNVNNRRGVKNNGMKKSNLVFDKKKRRMKRKIKSPMNKSPRDRRGRSDRNNYNNDIKSPRGSFLPSPRDRDRDRDNNNMPKKRLMFTKKKKRSNNNRRRSFNYRDDIIINDNSNKYNSHIYQYKQKRYKNNMNYMYGRNRSNSSGYYRNNNNNNFYPMNVYVPRKNYYSSSFDENNTNHSRVRPRGNSNNNGYVKYNSKKKSSGGFAYRYNNSSSNSSSSGGSSGNGYYSSNYVSPPSDDSSLYGSPQKHNFIIDPTDDSYEADINIEYKNEKLGVKKRGGSGSSNVNSSISNSSISSDDSNNNNGGSMPIPIERRKKANWRKKYINSWYTTNDSNWDYNEMQFQYGNGRNMNINYMTTSNDSNNNNNNGKDQEGRKK